jgi:hypothetical protein
MNRARQQAAISKLTGVDPSTITLAARFGCLSMFTGTLPSGKLVIAGMPTLKPNAPPRWRRVYFARIECNLTGRCPSCEATMGTGSNRVAQVNHEDNCPVIDPGLGDWVLTNMEGTP